MWFDDSKHPTADKISEALAAYLERFGQSANLVLVNEIDLVQEYPGALVCTGTSQGVPVQRNSFLVGILE